MKDTKMKKPLIQPTPGYLLTIPYIEEDKVFKSLRETQGEDQKSTVLAVGAPIQDTAGILRESPARVGDVIIHAASNKDFDEARVKHRFVHFAEVHGVYKK